MTRHHYGPHRAPNCQCEARYTCAACVAQSLHYPLTYRSTYYSQGGPVNISAKRNPSSNIEIVAGCQSGALSPEDAILLRDALTEAINTPALRKQSYGEWTISEEIVETPDTAPTWRIRVYCRGNYCNLINAFPRDRERTWARATDLAKLLTQNPTFRWQ